MESTLKFQRGDIYFVRLDSSTGSEQNGTRPAVILQNDVGNTHPFNSEETDGMSQREQLEKYFSQSLEVELLLRLCPDDEDQMHQRCR